MKSAHSNPLMRWTGMPWHYTFKGQISQNSSVLILPQKGGSWQSDMPPYHPHPNLASGKEPSALIKLENHLIPLCPKKVQEEFYIE